MVSFEITRLADSGIQAGKSKQLLRLCKTVDITNFAKNHPTVNRTNTWDGHNDRVQGLNNIVHFGFNFFELPVQ